MRYDFDAPVDRRNTYSLKWDVAENELPMWVADMDFRTAPEITQAYSATPRYRTSGIPPIQTGGVPGTGSR